MMDGVTYLLASSTAVLSLALPPWGAKAAFVGTFLVLIVILAALPGNRVDGAGPKTPVWRNVRYWAILIAAIQVLVYARWG